MVSQVKGMFYPINWAFIYEACKFAEMHAQGNGNDHLDALFV